MDRQASSLDRFLLHRGPALIGSVGRFSAVINGFIGGFFSLMGLGMVVGSGLTREPQMLGAATGPLIGGGVNLWVALMIRRRSTSLDRPTVQLSEEAKELLHRLMRAAFGWRYPWVGWESHRRHGLFGRRHRLRTAIWGGLDASTDQKPVDGVLHPEVFRLLDDAACHFNRIQGSLAAAGPDATGPLRKMRPAIVQAADETMAAVLHQAAMMEKYPESKTQGAEAAARRIQELREAADRIETMQVEAPPVQERLQGSTAMEGVLEELRLQQMAQDELRTPGEPPRQIENPG